jgi:hypothetical protein
VKSYDPLASIKGCVASGAFRLGKLRALETLAEYLGDVDLEARARVVTRAVFGMLQDSHFHRTEDDMMVDGKLTPFDVYGLGIGKRDLINLGFPDDGEPIPLSWYLKFALEAEQKVFVVSLHRLEFEMRRANGSPLKPRDA